MVRNSGDRYERNLEERLWEEGWATFRVAGSGTVSHASCDLVAMKDMRCLILEVKSVDSNRDVIRVDKDSRQLKELVKRSGMDAYIVVKIKGEEIWHATDKLYRDKLMVPDDLGYLYEVL